MATLLWHQRLTVMGVSISWSKFTPPGLGLTVIVDPTSVLVLWVV